MHTISAEYHKPHARAKAAHPHEPVIALALGSGSARGWAHIGVLRALIEADIHPHLIVGTSIGALVGAAHVTGHLNTLENWLKSLKRWDMLRLMDMNLRSGGILSGEKLISFFLNMMGDVLIDDLPTPFVAVATELATGREVWFRHGPLHEAVRASIAMPGLFAPVARGDQWLADGGLVNPVPISVCRSYENVDLVIAVSLNGDLLSRATLPLPAEKSSGRISQFLQKQAQLLSKISGSEKSTLIKPSIYSVIVGALTIMQDRITRSRMAGDPADVLISPQVNHLSMLDYHRASEAILAGETAVKEQLPIIRQRLEYIAKHKQSRL